MLCTQGRIEDFKSGCSSQNRYSVVGEDKCELWRKINEPVLLIGSERRHFSPHTEARPPHRQECLMRCRPAISTTIRVNKQNVHETAFNVRSLSPDLAFFLLLFFFNLMRRKSFCLGFSFSLSLTDPGEHRKPTVEPCLHGANGAIFQGSSKLQQK